MWLFQWLLAFSGNIENSQFTFFSVQLVIYMHTKLNYQFPCKLNYSYNSLTLELDDIIMILNLSF